MILNDKIQNILASLRENWLKIYRLHAVKVVLFVIVCTLLIFPYESKDRLILAWDSLTRWSNEARTKDGMIQVTTPRIYTRERLVNDRFEEVDWITLQLQEANKLLKDNKFGMPDSATQKFNDRQVSISETKENTSKPNGQGEKDISLQPLDQFERAAEYREALRHRLIGEYLDDTHDIDGNTLYRFDFSAAVLPPPRSNFIAAIQIDISELPIEKDTQVITLYRELLADWRDDISREARGVRNDRLANLERGSRFDVDETYNLEKFVDCRLAELIFLDKDKGKDKDKTDLLVSQECWKKGIKDEDILQTVESLKHQYVKAYRVSSTAGIENNFKKDIKKHLKTVAEGSITKLSNENINETIDKMPFNLEQYQRKCFENNKKLSVNDYLLSIGYPSILQDTSGVPYSISIECNPFPMPQNIDDIAKLDILGILSRMRETASLRDLARKGIDVNSCFKKLALEQDPLLGFSPPHPQINSLIDHDKLSKTISECILEKDEKAIDFNWDMNFKEEYANYSMSNQRKEIITQFVMNVFSNKKPQRSLQLSNDSNAETSSTTLKEEDQLPLNYFFKFEITGCSLGDCSIRVENESGREDQIFHLLNKYAYARTYSVTPEKRGRSNLSSTNDHVQAGAEALGTVASAGNRSSSQRIEVVNQVIGIADDWDMDKDEGNKKIAKFGWLILPHPEVVKADYPAMIKEVLTALVSMPSWWQLINFKVKTCWLPRSGIQHDIPVRDLCSTGTSDNESTSSWKIRLPGTSTDISRSLRYEVAKSPYIEATPGELPQVVEVGRKASLTINGRRLWKSPRVKLGSQWATRIEVLPNMKGLNVDFDCIKPSPGSPGGANQEYVRNPRQDPSESLPSLQIWTSEGMTNSIAVMSLPFTQRIGEQEVKPCWLTEDKNEKQH